MKTDKRIEHAQEWLESMPEDLVVKYHNDPEFHAWAKKGRQLIAADDKAHNRSHDEYAEQIKYALGNCRPLVKLTPKGEEAVSAEANA